MNEIKKKQESLPSKNRITKLLRVKIVDHPKDVDLAILEKMNTPSASAVSLTQLQVIRGILIAVGIIVGLVVLALALQYLHH